MFVMKLGAREDVNPFINFFDNFEAKNSNVLQMIRKILSNFNVEEFCFSAFSNS